MLVYFNLNTFYLFYYQNAGFFFIKRLNIRNLQKLLIFLRERYEIYSAKMLYNMQVVENKINESEGSKKNLFELKGM